LGAAFAAGLAVGVWSGTEELAALWSEEQRWEPLMEPAERERLYARWQEAVERSLGWAT
jgi:glycerol kinase